MTPANVAVAGESPGTLPGNLLADAVSDAKAVVLRELPEYWPRLEACLATIAALRLRDLDLCPTNIVTGPSGSGKSAVLAMLEGGLGITRVDSITSACFVTSASNKTLGELKGIDVLSRIQNQTMLTRDLSTVFRKNTDQLRDLLGVLIPVLDGKGYAPGSGTVGLRDEVTGDYEFAWIAATTPFPPQTWDTQKRFGSRLLHYDLFSRPMTDDEVLQQRAGKAFAQKLEACKEKVHKALAVIGLRRPDGASGSASAFRSVEWGDDGEEVNRWRVKLARFLVACRHMQGEFDDDEEDDPHRVITQLEAITRGRAMLEDRTVVTLDDMRLAVHMVLSSSRHGHILRAVAHHPNGLSAKECGDFLMKSEQTARNRMNAVVKRTGEQVVKEDARIAVSGHQAEKVLVPSQRFSWLGDLKALGWL